MSLARFSSGAQPPIPTKSRKEPNFSPDIFSQKFNVDSENQAPPRKSLLSTSPSKLSLNFTDVTLDQKSPNTLSKEEQYFVEALSKTNQLDDPLSLYNKYYKWCKNTFPKDEEKLFNILNDLTKNLAHIEKYKQDPHFVSKWTLYTKYCIDQEEVLKYMEENNIGTQLAMFYKAYCVVNIRKRNFSKANDWILMGKRKGAKPANKMDEFVKEFEDNMKERLHRDFYGQGKRLSDDDVIDIPALSSHQRNDSNLLDDLDLSQDNHNPFEIRTTGDMKRKCPFSNQIPKQVVNKRVKLNDLVNSIKMGEFNIYVDQECREAIPEGTKLVNEYDALCYKYDFTMTPSAPEGKYLSWISQQMPSELSMSLDVSNLTNQNSFSIHKDDSTAPGNHLVAQFQLPKKLRKPLKEIKPPTVTTPSFAENPALVNENERPSILPQQREPLQQQQQPQLPPQPVILSQKSSQEINDQYMPLFGSILEEDVAEEEVRRPKTVFNLYKEKQHQQKEEEPILRPARRITEENTEDAADEKSSHDDSYKFLIAVTTGAGKKKDSHNKKVTVVDDFTGSSEKNNKKKIRKTPHISHKYLAHTPDPEEQEEEQDLERMEQFNMLVKKDIIAEPKSIKKAQAEPMKELLASPAVSTVRAGNVMRNLDFGGIDVSGEEEDGRSEYRYGGQTPRSPLYRDLFGLDQPATSTLPQSYNIGEGTKKVVKKGFRMVKEIPKKELEILKGNRFEVGKRRIIPEIYRKEEPQKEKNELSDFEKYLEGISTWKDLNTPKKQVESDELSDLLFAAPRGDYY